MDSPVIPSTTSDDEGTLSRPDHSSVPVPVVSEEAGVLTLHFQSDYVQSQMRLDEPDSLTLTYSRTMMAFELFNPAPPKIAMIGLGGGSMAKWCYRHHPQAELTVVEINPHVIALRDRFRIPRDDHRFRILCEDGTKFVAETSSKFDVLLVDAFGIDHLPQELCTQRFYDDCYQTLTGSALMVVNLCEEDNRTILARIRRSFNSQVLLSPDNDGNTVVFACKGELLWSKGESPGSLQMKLRKFEKKYGLRRAMAPVS
jgi:spermidine synthase